jgi:hypothetical protein
VAAFIDGSLGRNRTLKNETNSLGGGSPAAIDRGDAGQLSNPEVCSAFLRKLAEIHRKLAARRG